MTRSEDGVAAPNGALHGIRVVDLSTVILAPWASQVLGDMGADVIKVETPAGDTTRKIGPHRHEGMASFFMASNRNKRSIVLDITRPEGRAALDRLLATADVFLHNFRPVVAEKLGVPYSIVGARFPNLVYCATYGFRRGGPLADKPAYDDIIQAACGLASLQSVSSDQPRYVPTVLADKTTSYNVVASILAALLHRERGGGGQEVEVPMFETMVDFLMVEHLYGSSFEPPIDCLGYPRIITRERRPYPTLDGYIAVLPYSDENWRALATLAGRPELMDDVRYATLGARMDNAPTVYATLSEILSTRTTAEWLDALEEANVPAMPVNSLDDLLTNEQLAATGFWRFADHPTEGRVRMPDPPTRFSKSPSGIRRLQPRMGEHSAEILAEAGFSATEIQTLADAGITHCAA